MIGLFKKWRKKKAEKNRQKLTDGLYVGFINQAEISATDYNFLKEPKTSDKKP